MNREEAFLISIHELPCLRNRMQAIRALRTLSAAMESVQQDADFLGNACTDVLLSLQAGTLRSVLEVTLRSGNYLNMGTSQGGAGAFHLEDLTKLSTVKGKSKACPTLLHFVAAQVLQQVRHSWGLGQDLECSVCATVADILLLIDPAQKSPVLSLHSSSFTSLPWLGLAT
jgi:hypothetical protein